VSDGTISVHGIVVSGLGEGAYFMGLSWVRVAVTHTLGFEPYPGTLNIRLADTGDRIAWRGVRDRPAWRLAPPPPDTCGGWLIPVVVVPDVRAAVVVPDVTRHADDVLEVIADVHVRSRLGLQDGDFVTLWLPRDPAARVRP
jgi:riboflavin kinase